MEIVFCNSLLTGIRISNEGLEWKNDPGTLKNFPSIYRN
jgi:hypothetical protein